MYFRDGYQDCQCLNLQKVQFNKNIKYWARKKYHLIKPLLRGFCDNKSQKECDKPFKDCYYKNI